MSFDSREDFIKAQSSEKITMVHINARTRVYEWTIHAGSVYKKTVPHFVVGLKQDQSDLTEVADIGSVVEGTFFYDSDTGILYSHFTGSVDPTTIQAIVTYRFFYASGPVSASWDLTNTGKHVRYDGRILSTPGYKHRVGIDQSLTAIVGSGTLKLENGDGGLDSIFDTLFFENREVTIYSWNRDLEFEDARVIYRGRVTNKKFSSNSVSFLVKDTLYDLEQALQLTPYDDTDDVNDNIKGRYKRRIYGRVDGLKLQSVDQIGTGYAITGTVTSAIASTTLTGTGTLFLAETSPGDTITIGTQEFGIEAVVSDTELTLDDEPAFSFTDEVAILTPEIPTTSKNRIFFVSGHACSNLTYTIINILQLNRIELSDTTGLRAGDFIEFATGERKEIKNVAPGNIIVLQSNLVTVPAISSDVIRQPVQRLFNEASTINADNFTISNLGAPTNECTVTLNDQVEFDLAKAIPLGVNMTFTNGSRVLTTADDVDLRENLSPRDWIRPADLSYTTYYEILSVDEQQIEIRTVFSEPTITDTVTVKLPDYIGDDAIISAEVIGKTEDGEPSGTWIETAPQAVKDILLDIGVPANLINDTSFTNALTDAAQTISIAFPLSVSGGAVTGKKSIDLLNKSVGGTLTLDNELKLQYRVLQSDVPDDPVRVYDEDLVSWSIETTNGKNFKDAVVKYRHKDVDRVSLSTGNLVQTFSSEFVRDYIETSMLKEFDAYLFNDEDAITFAQRQTYFNRLSRAKIVLKTDLRFEDVEIGDIMQLEMDRLYDRLGGDGSNEKLAVVVGKTVTGDKVELELSDLGNIFNSSSVITPNTTNEFASATTDEKLKYGFITDSQGIVEADESTANIHLIS